MTTITIEILKEKRNEIISEIKTNFSRVNVKEFMTSMIKMIPLSGSTNVIDYVEEVGDLLFSDFRTISNQELNNIGQVNKGRAMRNLPSSMR